MPFDLDSLPMLKTRTGGVRRTHGNRPSLAETHPEIARELVNAEVAWTITPGSTKKLKWCCIECEHNWNAVVYSRTQGRGCPACSNKTVTVTNCLAATHPELASELVDPEDAYKVTPGSGKELKWCCIECDHNWNAVVKNRTTQGDGCPACAGRVATETNCLAATHPELASELVNPDDGYKVTPGSHKKLNWCCVECEHNWNAVVYGRTSKASGCPACAGLVATETNCLVATNPELARELANPDDGYKVTPGSHKKLKWCCGKCGHNWNATANSRTTNGRGCPKCGEASRMNRWSAEVAAAMGANHATEARFDDCRDQLPLPFDLAVYSTDGQVLCLFEFQGMQHFKPVKWSRSMTDEQALATLEATQRRDQIKRDYARANGIKLIEFVAFATDRRDGEATFKRMLTEAIQEIIPEIN